MTMPGKHDRPASSTRRAISDLMLEQYNLHELSAAQERRVRGELERDQVLRGRLAAIQESDTEIRSAFPAERVVPQIRERMLREGAGAPSRTRRVPTTAWAVPAAAMVLFLVLVPLVTRQAGDTRLKGIAPHLLVFRKTTAGAEELRPGAVARRGDVLQLSYAAGDARYGVIFSVDGRGTLTWHVPARYAGGTYAAPPLDPKGPVVLPSAYELDDAPGFERFFLVYSAKPFDVSEVDPVARALSQRAGERGVLSLPHGLGQFTLLLKKHG
jgi:hypothetical protein